MNHSIAAQSERMRSQRMLGGFRVLFLSALLVAASFWLFSRVTGTAVMGVSKEHFPLKRASAASESRETVTVEPRPRNIIVFVADGLGFSHLSAARALLYGIDGAAVWDRFPFTGWQHTHPGRGYLTDSAASATAMATGVATRNGAIGVSVDGTPQTTLFERATASGYRTGLVTDSYIWDATPAAFVTHAAKRSDAASILRQLADTPLDVLFGELEDVGEEEVPTWDATVAMLEKRYSVRGPEPIDSAGLLQGLEVGQPVAAIFEEEQVTDLSSTPTLPDLVTAALDRIGSNEAPFLLLVESEEPDTASHRHDLGRLIRGMEAIAATLTIVLDFAEVEGETLVVFTSDHETGGLVLSVTDDSHSNLRALWASEDHTGVAVPVMAIGPGAEAFAGIQTNWQLGQRLASMLREPPAPPGLAASDRARGAQVP